MKSKSKKFELKHGKNSNLEIESSEDSLTSITGEFGRYQKIWCSLTALTSFTTSLLIYSNKFLTTKVNITHWGKSPNFWTKIGILMQNSILNFPLKSKLSESRIFEIVEFSRIKSRF